MRPNTNDQVLDYHKKNRRKRIKVIFQFVILIILSVIFLKAVFILSEYKPISSDEMSNTKGYISLSYFGVDRSGSAKYISKNELRKQLTLLKDQGFETISQQQLIDFHYNKTPLPEKALFLSFEDGRNDSSIFAQKTLEKLNYKATMFTYANKMNSKDMKFLKPNHLKSMMKSGYWELGSNGYRLTYINVFNDKGQYLGEIDENDVPDKTLIEYYNHYLMDYLRDEYMIPKETRIMAKERIETDYNLMSNIYEENFTFIPKAYAIMHANSLYNNMNDSIEQINDAMIKQHFSLHFNRDLTAYNEQKEDIYNLNRLQVSPQWPVNHLLMKIKQDAKMPMEFTSGEQSIANLWTVKNGVGEFSDYEIILTSEPNKIVTAYLKEKLPNTFIANFDLKGSVLGSQTVFIKNSNGKDTLRLVLKKNILYVYNGSKNNDENILLKMPLNELKWSGEDYAFNKATHYDYFDTQQGSRIEEDEYPSTLNNNRTINLILQDDILTIYVDRKMIDKIDMPFTSSTYQFGLGGHAISSDTTYEQYSDTIYDSIIEDLTITTGETDLYNTESTKGIISRSFSKMMSEMINFFIDNF